MTRSTGAVLSSGKAATEIGAMAFGGGLGLAINEVMDFILRPAAADDEDASFSKKIYDFTLKKAKIDKIWYVKNSV